MNLKTTKLKMLLLAYWGLLKTLAKVGLVRACMRRADGNYMNDARAAPTTRRAKQSEAAH
jgi:hypothetical protein